MSVQSGFSLIELLIGIAILSILATSALPSFGRMQQRGNLAIASDGLATSLRLARSEAVKRASRMTVCKSNSINSATPSCDNGATWQQGWLVFVDSDEDGVMDVGEELVQVHDQMHFGVAVTTSAVFSNNVSYNPLGATTTSANVFASGNIILDFSSYSKTLSLSPTGHVRIN